jgi:hypothetical protein
MDEKEKIILEIQRVANEVAPKKITKKDFLKLGSISEGKMRYHFNTWSNALVASGFQPNPSSIHVTKYECISDDELLGEIGRLWEKTGKQPTESLMNSEGKYSTSPYRKRWGKWSNAIVEFKTNCGIPSFESDEETSPSFTPMNYPAAELTGYQNSSNCTC